MSIDLLALGAIIANILGAVSILAVVIFAAVAWLKQLGLRGRRLTVAAFVVGLVIAVGVSYALTPMQTFADWFFAVLFGLMAGFLATGAYKGVENASGKAQIATAELSEYAPEQYER